MTQRLENERGNLEAREGLCKKLSEEPANLALAWLLTPKAVTEPILDPRVFEQLDGSLRAMEIQL